MSGALAIRNPSIRQLGRDALAAGARTFVADVPCKRGHLSERLSVNASCIACGKENFAGWWAAHGSDALVRNREWKSAHADQVKATAAEWERKNKDRHAALAREWKAANKEHVLAYSREYRIKYPDRVRAAVARWYAANSAYVIEHFAEQRRAYRALNRDKVRSWQRNYSARKRGAGSFTASDIEDILRMQKRRCAYCRKPLKSGFHVDHITALSKGGLNIRRNLQCTCPTCNRRKSAQHPVEFAQQIGLLL